MSDAQSSHQVELAELQESVAKNDDVQREMSLKVVTSSSSLFPTTS